MVHFGFEMADEFTCNTFPFRFTIPPASLDPSVPRPGPYLFHAGGMQNPQYPLLSTNALQFMPATSLHSTSSSAASSTSTGESSKNSPTEGSINRNRCPNSSDAETRFLLEIWRDSFPIIVEEEAVAHGTPLPEKVKPTLSCAYGDCGCFAAGLPVLPKSVASSPFVETLVASCERNVVSFGEIRRESVREKSFFRCCALL